VLVEQIGSLVQRGHVAVVGVVFESERVNRGLIREYRPEKSAEGAALNSHGRKAVVSVVPEQRRPEGPTLPSELEMPHLRRSTNFGICQSTA
jgi:hypothetical protein